MIFHLIVKHLHWLAGIPLVPHIFNSMLLCWCAVFDRPKLRAIEQLETAALCLRGVHPVIHRYGGMGFKFRNTEIAHLHGNGLLDVHLSKPIAQQLVADHRAQPHHVLGLSSWVSFWLQSETDVPAALELLKLSIACST